VIAEGNETPGGESGATSEGRTELRSTGRGEGDLLAERRARRAAESGEHALTLRAEAAEATVRTLETHVASLQQRVREAEQERRRLSEPLESDAGTRGGWRAQEPAAEVLLERELQRASQREYAEQRLRIEAEERSAEIERDARAEIDQLSKRLSASESEARALSARVDTLERELAEAEQATAAELAALRSESVAAEQSLRGRLGELERRALEIHRGLEAERAARARTERLLESMRSGIRGAVGLVAELADVAARLKQSASVSAPSTPEPLEPEQAGESLLARGARPPSAVAEHPVEGRQGEMAEALAAAVERLRARVEEQPEQSEQPPAAPIERRWHKHSKSLIGRLRIARKQRRER
jgi:chromosome segregation ATPase